MTAISAEILAHSTNKFGQELITFKLVHPRFILAELNTHRMFSRNSASSRAIPFNKMVKAVNDNPFIPVAWQREHQGMQGTDYLKSNIDKAFAKDLWLMARDKAVKAAEALHTNAADYKPLVTKQICNRLLEPFMWHTTVVTTGIEGFNNFIQLRAPRYKKGNNSYFTWNDYYAFEGDIKDADIVEKLLINKGMAEIHLSLLAEAMLEAFDSNIKRYLEPGEWHIPFIKYIDYKELHSLYEATGYNPNDPAPDYILKDAINTLALKVATTMVARTSYTIIGDEKELKYSNLIDIYDNKLDGQDPEHSSPFEHCSQSMHDYEFRAFSKTYVKRENDIKKLIIPSLHNSILLQDASPITEEDDLYKITEYGWCYNIRGYKSLRFIRDNKL